MEVWTVNGEQPTLSLTTLGKQKSVTECRVFKLEVFDLNEQNFVELPTVFSTPELPVSKNSIPQQEDVSKYPYLKGIPLPKIDAPIGLLIRNDVPKALEPKNRQRPVSSENNLRVDTQWSSWPKGKFPSHSELHQSRRGTQPAVHKVLQSRVQQFSVRQGRRAVQRRLACD